ncbi:SWIM zinc finger family protein [Verrucomicrobium spinosum]|uniref:SWIM zinc finger family protein n=1 Tax=Verrucomicrobium spinosum TaxID=2736 RepID=UPI0001745543|nr:SWIM zinc finger family protein [Verrucomicrobium spinosum]
MSWYSYSYDNYEDRAAAKARTKRKVDQRRKKGELLAPVVPKAKLGLSITFWGKAWNRNLEAYSDYSNRLPRGRTYLRQGAVMDLAIEQGEITSTVMGSDLYEVRITVKPLLKNRWQSLKEACTGGIGSLVELLGGKLSDQILQQVTDPQQGLFPAPKEILITCSCPDYAGLCKHAAATLYGVSCRLDDDPALFFKLRGVDAAELIGTSAVDAVHALTAVDADAQEGVIGAADLSDVFGIDLGNLEIPDGLLDAAPAAGPRAGAKVPPKKKVETRKIVRKKAASKKVAKKAKKAVTKKSAVKKKKA